MQVDIDQLKEGLKYLGDDYLFNTIKELNKIDSISLTGFKFNIGSYSTDINKYFSEIAKILQIL